MEEGIAKNTRRRLRDAWKKILTFTGERGFVECPMPVETCVKMIDWCWTQRGRYGQPYSPQSVKSMLWALTKAHNVARRPDGLRGYVTPVKSEEVRRAFRGYRKRYLAGKYRSDMASPISPEEVVAMIRTVDVRSPQGLRDALAIALLYDGGFRAGELVVSDEDRLGVRFEDVELAVDVDWDAVDWSRPQDIGVRGPDPETGSLRRTDHLVVHVPMSKTDQEGYGDEVIIPAHPPEYAFNCPVRLFIAWSKLLREQGHARRGTVLRVVAYGNRRPGDGRPQKGTLTEQPLGYQGLAYCFKRWVREAGLQDPEGFLRHLVLHGMRAGAAEAAAENDADTPELNRHFRWSQFGTTAQRYAARGRKRKQNPAARVWGRVAV
jgi:integrase